MDRLDPYNSELNLVAWAIMLLVAVLVGGR
jgi:hypothetical protein